MTMKQTDETVGVVIGKASPATTTICRMLAKEGISTLVVQKEATPPVSHNTDALTEQYGWSGQPGKDLFFNGWKLMF